MIEPNTDTIKVVLVDDHPLVRETARLLLAVRPRIMVEAEASDGVEAVDLVAEIEPDIVLLDIALPRLDGLEAARQIKQRFPGVKIVAFTVHEEQAYVREAIKAGATGYVRKRTMVKDLVATIEMVIAGEANVEMPLDE